MNNNDIRHLIRSQVEETPSWLRDAIYGLMLGAGLVSLWLLAQPSVAPKPAASTASTAASVPASMSASVSGAPARSIAASTPDAREAQSGPTGAPLLWAVRKGSATVYLFGSVHVLNPNLNWADPRLFRAFDGADEAWFEVPDLDKLPYFKGFSESAMAARPVVAAGLNDQEKHELETILNRYDWTLEDVARVKPWAMAGFVAELDRMAGSFRVEQGADFTLFHRARTLKHKTDGFEDNKTHYGYLYVLGTGKDEDGTRELKQALANHFGRGEMDDDINVIVKAWGTGDQKAMTDSLLRDRAVNPRVYDVLVVQRNHLWMPKIEGALNGEPGVRRTVFVTAGIDHFIGPDGLVAQLRAKGYTVERVER